MWLVSFPAALQMSSFSGTSCFRICSADLWEPINCTFWVLTHGCRLVVVQWQPILGMPQVFFDQTGCRHWNALIPSKPLWLLNFLAKTMTFPLWQLSWSPSKAALETVSRKMRRKNTTSNSIFIFSTTFWWSFHLANLLSLEVIRSFGAPATYMVSSFGLLRMNLKKSNKKCSLTCRSWL